MESGKYEYTRILVVQLERCGTMHRSSEEDSIFISGFSSTKHESLFRLLLGRYRRIDSHASGEANNDVEEKSVGCFTVSARHVIHFKTNALIWHARFSYTEKLAAFINLTWEFNA